MPEHYPTNVKQILAWCDTCRRRTMHRVDHKRLGTCTEHAPDGLSEAQRRQRAAREAAEQQPGLF